MCLSRTWPYLILCRNERMVVKVLVVVTLLVRGCLCAVVELGMTRLLAALMMCVFALRTLVTLARV